MIGPDDEYVYSDDPDAADIDWLYWLHFIEEREDYAAVWYQTQMGMWI